MYRCLFVFLIEEEKLFSKEMPEMRDIQWKDFSNDDDDDENSRVNFIPKMSFFSCSCSFSIVILNSLIFVIQPIELSGKASLNYFSLSHTLRVRLFSFVCVNIISLF